MAKKGNLCPNCEEEISEFTDPRIVNVYLAQRDLCADVECPGCGKIVNIVGRKLITMHTHDEVKC